MSPNDIEAGPELDRAVATEVMGWTPDGCGNYTIPGGGCVDHHEWAPSEYISHAWRVVERLSVVDHDNRYGKMELRSPALKPDGGHDWMCTFRAYLASDMEDYAHGKTAALAICRAALMCVRDGQRG